MKRNRGCGTGQLGERLGGGEEASPHGTPSVAIPQGETMSPGFQWMAAGQGHWEPRDRARFSEMNFHGHFGSF